MKSFSLLNLLETKKNNCTIIIKDFNILLLVIYWSIRKNISKHIQELNIIIYLNLILIYISLCILLSTHRKLHIMQEKNLKDLAWSRFSDCNRIKLEIDNNIIARKTSKVWKLNYTLLNNACFKKEIANNLETISNWMIMKIQHQNLWDTANTVVRGKFTTSNALEKRKCLRSMSKVSISRG